MSTEKIFKFGERFSYNACVSVFEGQLSTPAIGYKLAAESIFAGILINPGEVDSMILPLIFNCRHHLEIRFKEFHYFLNLRMNPHEDFPDGHNLTYLWDTLSPKIQRYQLDWWNRNQESVKSVVTQITQLDPQSDIFRYGIGPLKKGLRNQPLSQVDHINAIDFWEGISPVMDALEEVSYAIEELQFVD